jgi:hypothetical protein
MVVVMDDAGVGSAPWRPTFGGLLLTAFCDLLSGTTSRELSNDLNKWVLF